MILRTPRNWLRSARGMVLPATTLLFAPAASAQTGPVPVAPPTSSQTAPAAPGSTAPPTLAAPSAPAEPAAALAPAPTSAVLSEPVGPGADSDKHEKKKEKKRKKKEKKEKEKGKKEKGKKEKSGKKKHDASPGVTTSAGTLTLKGRVFALAELQHRRHLAAVGSGMGLALRGYESLDLSLASARIGLEYEAPVRWISAVAELELSGKASLKDGYVQARGTHFFGRMGQFKLPVAAIETESPWALPFARRGFLHDLLSNWLDVGGRQPGVMFGWRGRSGLRPRLMVGAFQGTVLVATAPGNRNTDLIDKASLKAQSYVARAQFEPADIQLGAWYEHRVGSPATSQTKHYFTAGVDAVVDRVVGGGGIRAWLEGTVGASWYEHINKPLDSKDATFIEGRALVAYRFGGTVDGAAYVEPFGFVGALEPDTDVRSDLAWEAAIGLNAGFWRRARLTLQGEINGAQRNFPSGYLAGEDPDRMGLLLQAGVAW